MERLPFPNKTEEEFKAWLRSLPPETRFCERWRVESCPIARFTGIETWKLIDVPDWAESFMAEYDKRAGETLAEALDIISP